MNSPNFKDDQRLVQPLFCCSKERWWYEVLRSWRQTGCPQEVLSWQSDVFTLRWWLIYVNLGRAIFFASTENTYCPLSFSRTMSALPGTDAVALSPTVGSTPSGNYIISDRMSMKTWLFPNFGSPQMVGKVLVCQNNQPPCPWSGETSLLYL